MKANCPILLPALAVFCLTVALLPAASFTEAKITRLEKDVKILKENAAPHPAIVGEKINAVTSVATGASSRAELMFPDNSLTRLGANSRFTIRGQGHTVDLDKGVLLFEVPEKLRDAKVRTAAVTAAVTGGTLIIEFLPGGFVKIMCIEGTVDFFLNKNPSEFSELQAGEMIIQPVDATRVYPKVPFNLKLLLKTSKLLNSDEEPNSKEIKEALNKQEGEIKDGDLVKTNLIIPGLGTVVQLTNDTRLDLINNFGARNGTPGGQTGGGQPGGNNPLPPSGPAFQGVVPLIKGVTVLNSGSYIKTDPYVRAYNVSTGTMLTSDGIVYNAAVDGPFPYFGFGSLKISDPDLQARLEAKDKWAAYKFEKLLINGTPEFDIPTFYCGGSYQVTSFSSEIPVNNTIPNIILSALGDITLAVDDQFATYEGSPAQSTSPSLNTKHNGVESLVLYSQNGNITLAEGFEIKGANQEFSIVAAGVASDITLEGDIKIYNGTLLVSAGQDLLVDSNVRADDIIFRAGRDITINGTGGTESNQYIVEATKGNLLVSAKRNIKITNSAQLKALSEQPVESLIAAADALLRIESLEGDIAIDGGSTIQGTNIEIEALKGNLSVVDSTLTATHALKMRTQGPNGELLINGSVLTAGGSLNAGDLIRLYAEGSNGKVLFQGNVTLDSDEVQIVGKTVQVDPGGNVNVPKGNTHVFSDNHNYNIVGYGNINSGNSLQQYNFNHASKPDFKTGGKLGRSVSY